MTYSITTSFFNASESVQKGTAVADVVIITGLVVVSALTLIGYFAQLQPLAGLAVLYPIAAYSMIAVAVVIAIIDVAVYCVKKCKADAENSLDKKSIPNDIEESSLTDEEVKSGPPKTKIETKKSETQAHKEIDESWQTGTAKLVDQFYVQFCKLNPQFNKTKLLECFFENVNAEKAGKSNLHAFLPEYLADYYDVDIDILRKAIFDENHNLTKDVLELVLELFGKIKVAVGEEKKSAGYRVEQQIKAAIKTALKVTGQTPIALTDWEAISLRHLIFLSDGCFYDLAPGDDLIYLKSELGEGGKRRSPVNLGHSYTDEDVQKFNHKVKKLGIKLEEAKRAEAKEEKPQPFPFRSLINMIEDLVSAPDGSIEAAMTPYVEDFTRPDVRQLKMPNYRNKTVAEIMDLVERTNFELNMHQFALCLWNAIAFTRQYHMPPPSQALMHASRILGIPIYTF